MRFIRECKTDDTRELFHKLRAIRLWFVAFPILTSLVPLVPLVIRYPKTLWWTLLVYPGAILVVTAMIAVVYGRVFSELERRMGGTAE